MTSQSVQPHPHAHTELPDLELDTLASDPLLAESHYDGSEHPASHPSDDGTNESTYRQRTERSRSVTPFASLLSRIWHVMSRAPLLLRSSSSLGTSSYGAVATSSEHVYDSDDGDELHRTQSAHIGVDGDGRYANPRQEHHLVHQRRRRSSSFTSDIAQGPDAKTTFGLGHSIPEGRGVSSNASLRTTDEQHDQSWTDQSPPDNSQYPEVRASVQPTDNTALSINTPRMWILSVLFAIAGSATNLFFSLRYPSVAITPVIALVLVHPLGIAWDLTLKQEHDFDEMFVDGDLDPDSSPDQPQPLLSQLRRWLAQGRWNEKEHACVYISSNVSFGFAFATDVIVEQHKFYKQDVTILYQILLTISTQILGYAFAGLTRRYLVRPAAMIWPGTLMSTAMFTTMHKNENKTANGWTISRYRFFIYIWAGAFGWYFLPGLLMPALSYFNVVTWFAPKNVVVANLFGVVSGLGLFPMTFDWAQIAYIGSPLLTPWWAAANVVGGLVLVMWLIAPIMYYRNVLFSAYLPILSSAVFDNTGKPYDVSRILTPNFLFDKVAYESYSHVYLPITYVLSYGVQFASLTALVTHTTCWHGRDIWRQSQEAFSDHEEKHSSDTYNPIPQSSSNSTLRPIATSNTDVHNRLMARYPDVPLIWYLLTFVLMFGIGLFVTQYYPVHLPWYGLILALSITALLFIPVGIVMAITNQHSSLYLICQLICGVVFPGRPVANMVFVTYCYISSAQGIKFSSDLKLGQYMKIPPRLLFKLQLIATLISSVTQIAVLNWMFVNIDGICTPEAVNNFTCPIARVHFNGSILWGVVGPHRFFGPGALYRPLIWAFLIGFIAPILIWLVGRNKPGNSIWRKINLPVVFGSLSWIPPATGLNFSVWAVVCFIFNSVIRRRRSEWWGKYTMTMSAALDSGLAFALVVVFFGFVYPGWSWVNNLHWWGTEVYKQGCDWTACAWLGLQAGEKFGP